MIGRREFTGALCASIGAYALIEAVAGARALARPSRAAMSWVDAQQQIAAALAAGRIAPRDWQSEVERLAGEVHLPELLAATDYARLKASFDFKDGMPSKRFVRFGEGAPALSYGLAFFGFRRGQAITPHAHRNMVSAHMVVAGALRVRTFDRLRDEPGALIVRPTRDRRIAPSDVSTMSSQRDNVHWFVAEEDDSATLDVIIDALEPGRDAYTIELIDPLGGRALGDGSLRAPIIGWKESVSKYGPA
jgi:hypothetical protein